MILTNNQINQAGETLKHTPDNSDALSMLSIWRANHLHALDLAFKLVKRHTDKVGNQAIYGKRLKRISSILHKLHRNPKMKMSRMQDIGGCRVILSDYVKVLNLYELLKQSKSILPNDKNYIFYPKEDGYRSIHLIYQCNSPNPEYDELKIEIQLRTKLQHAWATTVEIIDTFDGQGLKLGGGTDDWKEFFRLVSDEFAWLEKLPIIDRNVEQNRTRLKELSTKLNVMEKLAGYAGFIKFSDTDNMVKNAAYSILELHIDTMKHCFTVYRNIDDAKDAYLRLETEYLNNDLVNVLMLPMVNIKQIKESYPNYFADSDKFIATLNQIINH